MTKRCKPNLGVASLLASTSLFAIGGLVAAPAFAQDAAVEDDDAEARKLDPITVTATRRETDSQDTAVTLGVLSEDALDNLRIDNFEDYVSLIPGVNATGQGPGKQDVFIRGVTPGPATVRLAALGSEPSVAIYLDEIPISTAGRNIDLYATDLSRIEFLKGPQGTLFGASSQAGTLRLITNKPNLTEYEAGGVLDVSTTEGGEESHAIEGYVSIPIVKDKLAVRLAAYNAREGGFIDSIPATRQIPETNPGLQYVAFLFGGFVPPRETVNNDGIAKDDFNVSEFTGLRASVAYEINDDWDILVQHTDQSLETEGVYEFEPDLSTDDDLNVATFSPDEGSDDVALTNWTVNGRVGKLDLIYNGSFAERTFEGRTDYTNYSNGGPFIAYYLCAADFSSCGSPILSAESFFETERTIHEFRVSTDETNRLRAIGGVFFDDQTTIERTDFNYPASIGAGFQPNFPIPGAFASNPNVRAPGITFFNDFQRDREEFSLFGELAFDLTDQLTATIGARNYDIEIGLRGQSSAGSRLPGPEAAEGRNVDEILDGLVPTTLSDTIYKFNLSWTPQDDVLLYATYSEGFRAGGFNRNGGETDGTRTIPPFYESDDVKNYELGWKTEFFNNSLRFNGAVYFIEFNEIQQGLVDPTLSNIAFFDNVGDAEVTGLEVDAEWAATDELTLFGNMSILDTELTDFPDTPVAVAVVPIGSQLPFAPEFQSVIGGRYVKDIGDYSVFGQGIVAYNGERFNTLNAAFREQLDAYTEVNISAGISRDQWNVTVYADNVTNELGELGAGAPDGVFRVSPIRPRTIGVRLGVDF